MDAEGITHDYVFKARSHRHAKRDVHDWLARTEWAETLVEITPIAQSRRGTPRRRRVAIAAATFALSGITIIAMIVVALNLESAL